MKNENVHIKLEISRDSSTVKLSLFTKFNPNSPNFIKEENGFSWSSTPEVRAFLNEAFEMITKK
jgi:hypothetical protein